MEQKTFLKAFEFRDPMGERKFDALSNNGPYSINRLYDTSMYTLSITIVKVYIDGA